MKTTGLVAVVVTLVAVGAASASQTAYKPFTNPSLAAKRLVVQLRQVPMRSVRCAPVNPYRIDCTGIYHGLKAKAVYHKINPYMLQQDIYVAGQHNTGLVETKVAY